MLKTMKAKYAGRCSITKVKINPGDEITYDTISRKAYLVEPGDPEIVGDFDPDQLSYLSKKYVSNIFNIGNKEYFRNKLGLCEDAPCCGCCTG